MSVPRRFVRSTTLALLAALPLTLAGQQAIATPLRPATLTCEYQQNPLGLDTMRPRFGWLCQASAGQRNARQTGYRILVATNPSLLEVGKADAWDSLFVDSDRSSGIDYRGKALTSGTRYYWTVKIWNERGEASGWSKPASWTMGLLTKNDWMARWITAPEALQKGQETPLLRRAFSVNKPIKRATLTVTGLGFYELHLNGSKVGDHEMDPGFTRYDKRVLYSTFDVTGQVHVGDNALGMLLGNGWYNYAVAAAWDFDKAEWRDKPKALAQLNLVFEDGTTQIIGTDQSWKAHAGPLVDNQLMTGETYDARREVAGWDTPHFNDLSWQTVSFATPPTGVLSAQTYPAIKRFQTFKAISVTEPKKGVFVFDFGQNFAGIEQLKVSGPAGTQVKMQFGEILRADGTLNQDKIKIHTHQEGFQTDTYVLKGKGTETYTPRFTYHGFRYAEVTGFPGKPTAESLKAIVLHAGFERAGSFACNEELLNKIQAATEWAYVSNFLSIPTDCPTREKNGWMGDAQLAAETGLYNYNGGLNYAKWIRDMQDAMRPTGELPGIVPTGGWGFAWGNGPAWDAAYPFISWDLYLFSGDRHILDEQYAGLKRYVDYVDKKSPDHIANFGLNDWAPFKTETPTDITSTGYFYRDTEIVLRAARLLNRREDIRHYSELLASIRGAFETRFLHANSDVVGTNSQTAISCALYFHLVPDARRKEYTAALVRSIDAAGGHIDLGILGAKYILHALTDNGRQDVAYKLASRSEYPSWGYWVTHGATTLLEQWNDNNDGDLSRNHIMFGDISAWYYETLGGIAPDPEYPGFKRTILHPHVFECPLTRVRTTHKTNYGEIVSEWTKTGTRIDWEVTVPANTDALVYIPCIGSDLPTEGGQAVTAVNGITVLGKEGDAFKCRIGSGTYHFVSGGTN
jgi:alpha-L-rhamnosidase